MPWQQPSNPLDLRPLPLRRNQPPATDSPGADSNTPPFFRIISLEPERQGKLSVGAAQRYDIDLTARSQVKPLIRRHFSGSFG
jgi:hypothetical protein